MPVEAPPAPPPPAPASTPAPPPPPAEKPPQDYLGDITGELAEMDVAGTPEPPPKPRDDKGKFAKPPEKPVPAKPAAKATAEPKPDVDEPKPPADEVKPAGDETPKPVRAADLRNAYDGLKKKVREELEPEVQRLRAKVQEYESKGPEESGPILEKIKTLETANAELEKRIALLDYEQSQEFSTKYDQPYRQMWDRASHAFAQLVIKEPAGEDDTGEPKFTSRRATEADLIKLGALPLSELDEAAQTMFGASAPRAVQYIEKLRELAEAKQTALEEAKTKAGEWRSQRTLEFQNRQKTLATAWTEINTSLKEKFPKAFAPEEGNAEDAASHTKGFALADLMFLGSASMTPEQVEALPAGFRDTVKAGKPLSEIQKVQLHALARLKMANHDRLVAARKRDRARIEELEKSLAEYEKSEPSAKTAGTARQATDKPWDQTVAEELKALDR